LRSCAVLASASVLTFDVPCLFRTEPGVDLLATGPLNRPKDGLAPLTGIIETDWAPYTFTMNWVFTRAQLVVLERGEPFCHIFPMGRGSLEQIEPEMRRLSEAPEIERQHKQWSASRDCFNDRRYDGVLSRNRRYSACTSVLV
jgi:Family of unknown function (DUF6065)